MISCDWYKQQYLDSIFDNCQTELLFTSVEPRGNSIAHNRPLRKPVLLKHSHIFSRDTDALLLTSQESDIQPWWTSVFNNALHLKIQKMVVNFNRNKTSQCRNSMTLLEICPDLEVVVVSAFHTIKESTCNLVEVCAL